MRDDSLDTVLTQESGNASVVLGRRTLIMQSVPGHLDLLPTFNPAIDDVGDCDPLRAAPTVVDLSITGHGHTNDHARRVLSRSPPGRIWGPFQDGTVWLHAPQVALVLVSDATIAAPTNPAHRCARSWACGRVVRVETIRSARSPVQHGLRALLARRRPGGAWCTVHFRSKDVQFAFGESSWGRSPSWNVAVQLEPRSRPRDLRHGT